MIILKLNDFYIVKDNKNKKPWLNKILFNQLKIIDIKKAALLRPVKVITHSIKQIHGFKIT